MSLKKKEIQLHQLNFLKNNIDFSPKVDLNKYKNLISDWSGIFLEFAICNNKKPHLFNSKKKVLNTDYNYIYKNLSLEEYARKKICYNYKFNEIDLLIENLKKDNENNDAIVKKFVIADRNLISEIRAIEQKEMRELAWNSLIQKFRRAKTECVWWR